MSDLVSIIVRTQGLRPTLLAEALDTIVQQTYPEVEVLVVEDGANNSANCVRAANLKRPGAFRHISLPKSGRGAAGNVGLSLSKGNLIGFLDDDDGFKSNHISTLVASLGRDLESDLTYGLAIPRYVDRSRNDGVLEEGETEGDVPFSRTLLWQRNRFPIQAALFRRQLYERHGGFDVALDALEDWDLWLRYSAEKDFVAVPIVTSWYRTFASKKVRIARASEHSSARETVIAKHQNSRGLHRFGDLDALLDRVRGEISFRKAVRIAFDRVAAKLIGK